jgi:hypothetical protein
MPSSEISRQTRAPDVDSARPVHLVSTKQPVGAPDSRNQNREARMAGVKGRSGGFRPGSGRKRVYPIAREVVQALEEIRVRLARIERGEHGPLILNRITEIERHLGMREPPTPPRHTRRRPLGHA